MSSTTCPCDFFFFQETLFDNVIVICYDLTNNIITRTNQNNYERPLYI